MSAVAVNEFGLAKLAPLKKLEYLGLADLRLGEQGMKAVLGMEEMRELVVQNSTITDAQAKQLAKLRKLRALEIHSNPVKDETLDELRKSLPRCQIRRR